jgi:deoxyribodipyrimidine photo-lyase
MILPTLQELGLEFSEIDSRAAIQFKGGETAAMQRLNHYFLKQKIFPSIKKLEMEWWAERTLQNFRLVSYGLYFT